MGENRATKRKGEGSNKRGNQDPSPQARSDEAIWELGAAQGAAMQQVWDAERMGKWNPTFAHSRQRGDIPGKQIPTTPAEIVLNNPQVGSP